MPADFVPIIDYTFPGLIWKLESDVSAEILYIETRNSETRTVHFSSFSLKNGEVYFSELALEEKWLIGLEGGRRGVLFLHGYKSGQSPEHKAVIALDAFNGKQLWADYNLALEAFTEQGLLAADQRFQSKRTVLLDYQTGNPVAEFENQDDPQQIEYPQVLRLPPQNIAGLINGNIIGEVSCLNYNSYLIISLHTQNQGGLVQHLFMIENEVIIYHDLLNEHIQKLQPEAFILINNHLIYIKNKFNLKVLTL